MSEWNDLVRFSRAKFSTAIDRCPNGRYTIVGSVPVELTHEKLSGYSVIRAANVYDTEQDVIDALLGLGVTHFQRADCSWYDAEAVA